MKLVHIVVGDVAAQTLQNAFNPEETADENIFVVKDIFNVGPLRSEELKFAELRAQFWQMVSGTEKELVVDDLDRLMQLSTQLTNEEVDQVWFWMSPIPADVCTYFWLLHFLKKHIGKLFVININGLPFLDEEGKLFYPESISALPPKQVLKAKKLARPITPSEWETEGDEWKRLIHEANVGIRINEGGRKIVGKPIDFYDKNLLDACTQQNQKITKLLGTVMQKHKVFTGDTFLHWRLRTMAQQHQVTITKDSIKLFDGSAELTELNEPTS